MDVPEIDVLSLKVVEGTLLHLHQNDVLFDLENYSMNIDENVKWGDVVADTEEGREGMDADPYWLASLFVLLNDKSGVVLKENGDERPETC